MKETLESVTGLVLSPISVFTRMQHTSLKDSNDLLKKAYQEGIYHFTTEENASKIIDSSYVKASGITKSYGTKRSFFFAGIPDMDVLALNGLPLAKEITAVKIKLPYEELASFDYRSSSDEALSFKGNLHFDSKNAEIVHLGLHFDGKNFSYQEISKDKKVSMSQEEVNALCINLASQIKYIAKGFQKEYQILKENVSSLQEKHGLSR